MQDILQVSIAFLGSSIAYIDYLPDFQNVSVSKQVVHLFGVSSNLENMKIQGPATQDC